MEGDRSQMPFEWLVSRVCEEFSCLPSQAVKELMDDPLQMATEIMHLRSYAEAKHILDSATSQEDIPKGMDKSIGLVLKIQAQIMTEDKEKESGNSS